MLIDVQCFQRRPAIDLESPGQILNRYTQHQPRIASTHLADQAAMPGPTPRIPTSNIPRTQHQIGALGRRYQTREITRIVREIGIHLRYELGVSLQGVPEARHIRTPDTVFPGAGKEVDLPGKPICQGTNDRGRPVGGAIVHDQNAVPRSQRQNALDERSNRLCFVIGRHNDGDRTVHWRSVGRSFVQLQPPAGNSGICQFFTRFALTAREVKGNLGQQRIDVEWLGKRGISIGQLFGLTCAMCARQTSPRSAHRPFRDRS